MSACAATVGEFLLEGSLEPEQVSAYLSSGRCKSWLCLNAEADGPAKCPADAVKASDVAWECVPVMPPAGFTRENADAIVAKLDTMARPTMIQCNTATRASAALVLYLSRKQSCDHAGAMQLATMLNLKCKEAPPPIVKWIAEGLQPAPVVFRQMFDTAGSSTYTYLLADPTTKEALLIDPVLEMVERDLAAVDALGLTLKYCLNTHCHADHITGSGEIKKQKPGVQSLIAEASGAKADVQLKHGDTVSMGAVQLAVRATPGHTNGCISFVTEANGGMVFTGDALLIDGCGRTDFQEGSAENLYDSVHQQIFSLPDHYKVLPAHNYKGLMETTVGEQKRRNPRLTKPKAEFCEIMKNLGLPYPKKLDVSLPANLNCGV